MNASLWTARADRFDGSAHGLHGIINSCTRTHDGPRQPDYYNIALRQSSKSNACHDAIARRMLREAIHKNFRNGIRLDQIFVCHDLPLPERVEGQSALFHWNRPTKYRRTIELRASSRTAACFEMKQVLA